MRLLRMMLVITLTAFALISLMFLLMVRVTDPLMPRAMFGVLNTVLYFPSGAVYPQQGFPGWMQAIAVVDPFTYAVHAFKSLLLKNTGFDAIAYDLLFLLLFSAVAMTAATAALQADAVADRTCCNASGRSARRRERETRERLLSTARTTVRRARLLEGHDSRDLQERPRQRRRRQLSLQRQEGAVRRGRAIGHQDDADDDRGDS